jgi:hypothetical protein
MSDETTLSGIFKKAQQLPPRDHYRYVMDQSSRTLAKRSLHKWRIKDLPPTPDNGRVVLIAVAVYSLPELELLDAVLKNLSERQNPEERLEILDAQTCSQPEFDARIPGIGRVLQTPVVGVCKNGVLTQRAWGYQAVEIIRRHYRLA